MDLNRHFSKECIPTANTHIQGCPALLTVGEIQSETMRDHFIPSRLNNAKDTY